MPNSFASRIRTTLTIVTAALATSAMASPVTLTGDYLKLGISDYGTLGSDSNTSPGLLHDPSGHGNFGVNDYITPGTPHEGFTVAADQFYSASDNDGASADFGFTSPMLLTGAAANGFAHAASWSGTNGFIDITNSYFFNDGDQRIVVTTKITALSDITGLAFARSVDPDPDVNTFGSFSTDNQRGNTVFGIDDFVGAAGADTGLTLALINFNGDAFAHSTQINGSCCSNINPFDVLNHTGGDQGLAASGDFGINLAYDLGSLTSGDSLTLTYNYAVGDKIGTVGGGGSDVPEPAVWALMLVGFGSVGTVMRRRTTGVVTV